MIDELDMASVLEEQRSHIEAVARRYDVVPQIHPQDMQFAFLVRSVFRSHPAQAVDAYFAGGEECCRKFASVYAEAGKRGGSVLEIASGYGRVARHSRKVLPGVKWVCCDAHSEAVEFNEWTVGVRAITSSSKPERFDVGLETFDAVFAPSFFCHSVDETFGPWLAKLYESVATEGVLIFAARGDVVARDMCAGDIEAVYEDDFVWNPAGDQRDLDVDEYETRSVTSDDVRRTIGRLSRHALIQIRQAFWPGRRDLYVVRKLPEVPRPVDMSRRSASPCVDVNSPPETWADFNVLPGLDYLVQQSLVAPFPPQALMHRVSGLTDEKDFAQHGKHIFLALSQASPRNLSAFGSVLDFGVGSGRLARMFMGFKGCYFGADVDHELINWASSTMPWIAPIYTSPRKALPCEDALFDLVISVSVFTHMSELDSEFYLKELHRVTKPGATLLLTVHGERALQRAETEDVIFNMLGVGRADIGAARLKIHSAGFAFILQPQGHLTTDQYEYGISFTDADYVRSEWGELFDVKAIHLGAIYDFQDIVVLSR